MQSNTFAFKRGENHVLLTVNVQKMTLRRVDVPDVAMAAVTVKPTFL